MKQEPRKPRGVDRSRLPWERPEIQYLGRFEDLVQGGGKFGSVADGDPQITLKPGVG